MRGINVGGNKRMTMTDLKLLYETLGFEQIDSYIQSGNVVFCSNMTSTTEIGKALSAAIYQKYGFEVPVLVRTLTEVEALLTSNPFISMGFNENELYISLLSELPSTAAIEQLNALPNFGDECCIKGREIYLHCPHSYMQTRWQNSFLEKKLKIIATTRNWRTIQEMHRLCWNKS